MNRANARDRGRVCERKKDCLNGIRKTICQITIETIVTRAHDYICWSVGFHFFPYLFLLGFFAGCSYGICCPAVLLIFFSRAATATIALLLQNTIRY